MSLLSTTFGHAKLRFEAWTQRHTAWPWLACVSLLLPVGLWALVLQPLQGNVADLRLQAAAASAAVLRPAPTLVPPASASLEPQVARLLADDLEATRLIERLFVLADHRGLQLRRGEYKAAQLKAIDVDSVQVGLPLQGSYAAIRAWIGDVLAQVPQASIERMALRRDDPASARVDADLVLTLWRKAPSQVDGRGRGRGPSRREVQP